MSGDERRIFYSDRLEFSLLKGLETEPADQDKREQRYQPKQRRLLHLIYVQLDLFKSRVQESVSQVKIGDRGNVTPCRVEFVCANRQRAKKICESLAKIANARF